MIRQEIMLNEYRNRIEVVDNVLSETRAKLTKAEHDRDRYKAEIERLKAQQREIDDLKAENKQLKTECALLDDELRIARQETIDVLNKLKTKAFDKDAFNGWAGSTFVVLVRDIDKMIEELTKCQK
jgi:cell division protein FtsB